MNQRQLLSSALASVLALGLAQAAHAGDDASANKNKEKCFGIVKGGFEKMCDEA